MKKRGKPLANILSKIGRKPGPDDTSDQSEQEGASHLTELRPEAPAVNGREAEISAKPEMPDDLPKTEIAVNIDEEPGRWESDEAGLHINMNLKRAQDSIQHRQKAKALRDRSQSVFAQSESIIEEAIRSAEAAGKAYGQGLAADFPANTEAAARARKMADALKSRLAESRSAYQGALARALETMAMATQDWVAALDSSDFEILNAERELGESAKASAIADSLAESAMVDLIAVHAMWKGLESQRQEPLARPGGVPRESTVDLPISNGQTASETLRRELAGLMTKPTPAPKPDQNAPVPTVVASEPLAQTYTGRVYLMFSASLTREGLESVWDAVEQAAGSGVIVDTRLVSQADGVQVTLDLDNSNLDVAAFLRRLRGAELVPIAEDRLKVAWPVAV